jgi:hypothetical protein
MFDLARGVVCYFVVVESCDAGRGSGGKWVPFYRKNSERKKGTY